MIQTGQGGQRGTKATGRDKCNQADVTVRCDSRSRGNSRRPNKNTGEKQPRVEAECDTNLPVYKTVNNSCNIQSNFFNCCTTNTDFVINKRSELLSVIESEGHDNICIRETLPKDQGWRIDPAESQFQDFDHFYNVGQKQCHRGVDT